MEPRDVFVNSWIARGVVDWRISLNRLTSACLFGIYTERQSHKHSLTIQHYFRKE